MTDEEYLSERSRIQTDDRYPPSLIAWLLGKLDEMYREKNGKEPPQ